MGSALDRLRKLIGEEEEEQEGATSRTPANAKSKAALKELQETGETTYRGKVYVLPAKKKAQEQRNAASAGEAMDIVRGMGDYLTERKEAETPQPVKRERNLGPNALTPEMEFRHQQASGGGNRLTPYQLAMQATMAAAPRQEETRSTDELRREMNRQNRWANATTRMAADMGNQLTRNQGLMYDPVYTSNLRTMGRTMEEQQNKATQAQTHYQAVKEQRKAEEAWSKYSPLLNNPDFLEMSKPDLNNENRVYYSMAHSQEAIEENGANVNAAAYATDDEKRMYYYLWNTQGSGAANAYYYNYVEHAASARKAVDVELRTAARIQNNGFLGDVRDSFKSIGTNAISGIGIIDIALQNIGAEVSNLLGLGDPGINYYSLAQMPGIVTDAIRSNVAKKIAESTPGLTIGKAENAVNVASFLYETGMSMADSGVAILLNTVGVPEAATLAMMGAAAGTRAIRDARERGASDGQALAFGLSSAIMEALFEKISLDSILKESNAHNLAQSILGTLKQGVTEGSEEVMTTLANTVADQMIMGDKSELFTRQRQLMEQGVSEKEALAAAAKQWGTGILGDAIGGFLSGVGMGGVKEFSSARNNPLYRWNMPMAEARALQEIEQNGLPQERGITPELQRRIDAAISEQNEREMAQDRAMLAEDAARRREAAQRRAAPPLPQQAGQEQKERAETPPLPGNTQRGAEGTRADTNGQERTEEVPHPALRATFPQGKAETEKRNGPPVPQRVSEESQTLGNPPVPGLRVAETGGNNSEENRLRIPENPQNVRNSGDNSQEARLRIPAAESRNDAEILWTAPKDNGGWKRQYNGNTPMLDAMKATNEELLAAYMSEATEGNTDTPVIDAVIAVWEDVRQGTISPMAGAELVNQMWQAGKDDASRRAYLQSIYNPSTGNLTQQALKAARNIDIKHRGGVRVGQAENPAAAVGQQANAGQNETAPAAEAAEAGNDLADGGRGGLSGQRAGEQDGRLAKLAEARSAVSQFDTASRRRSDAKNLPSERVNARDHIAEAAEGSTLTFAPEQMVQQDKELRSVKRRLESITGRKVYYTLGGIKRTGADGKTGTARGAITPDGIYLRCDDDSASVTQLAGHELYHYYEEQFPGLHDRVRQKITERYSEEEFREVAGRYTEKLGRLNGLAENMDAESYEAMVRRIESEIFADAFGNINYFQLGADRYTDAARETVNETLGSEAAAATERRTGPPETRFSIAEIRGEKEDYGKAVVLDTNIFNGISPRNWGKVLGDFVYNHLAGTKAVMYDENGNPETIEFARKNDRVKKDGANNSHRVLDKLARYNGDNIKALATVQLSELLKVSGNETSTGEHSHQWMDENGWTLRTAYVVDRDGNIYEATLNIANGRDRRILYAISNVRKIDEIATGGDVPSSNTEGARSTSHSDPTHKVAETTPDVKTLETEINAAGLPLTSKENNKNNQRIRAWLKENYPALAERVRFFNDKATGRVTVEGIDEQSEGERARNAEREAAAQRQRNEKINARYGLTHENSQQDSGLIRSFEDRDAVISALEDALGDMPGVTDAEVKGSRGMGSYETLYIQAELENGESVEYRLSNHESRYGGADRYFWNGKYENVEQLIKDVQSAVREDAGMGGETSFSASEDEDIPDNAAEYSRQRYREENREPQSAAEYSQMKQRALEREAEIRKLEKKGEASAEDRREAAWARREFEAPKEKANKQQATIAKKDLRNTIINEFGIPDGRKAEIGKLIDAYADQVYKDGKLTETDRQALFDKLYSEGVMTVPADDAFQAAREIIKGGRVYVPERVKHEFGDDWSSFRREAFAEGILLTNNKDDMGWDSWNVELSAELPGLFAEDETDPRNFLERVVHLAREGRDQEMSLAEYAASVIGTEYVSEDDLLNNMERKLDWALRSYADKAGLEIWIKNKTEEKLARQREKFGERLDRERAQRLAKEQKEREKRKEAARRQARNRELREMQERTLKQIQWLSRNRQKFSGNMQDRLNEILSDIDVYAISAADEAHLDKASNKTWRELADIYKDARENDPNFLPSKDLERIVGRLDNRKIGDMDIDAVTELYKAAVGLRTELYNRNNVIGSELHETFQEVYDQVKDEMQKAKGGYQSGPKGKAQKFFSDLQLTPMNVLERMAGWNKDSAWYKMAKQLEQGERAQRKFKTDSARMLAPFLEEHKEWVKKADGQGKDAIWYEVEVPELLELGMGDKPIFGNTVKVWMTPAQKVHMYLESQNYDNLRHMTGGRTFADKELYSKGKRAEAFAQGKTIRLAPESVKNLVKDLTPEEKALADALRPFYNEFSKKEINRVSNLLLGYNKAMEGDYAPIYTNKNYTKSEPGIFDTTAEGVGNLKSRVVSATPSLNISALDAFEKSVDRTSRYVGLAIPVRNMNTLMNWREKGNSMADVLTHKWGNWALAYINGGSWEAENGKKHNEIGLLNELQGGRADSGNSIEALTDAALSRYISAVFGANPSIVTKQFASYPLAAAYLGWDNMPLNVPGAARVDTDLIAKYTGEYDYRQLGYAMPETATLKDNPGKLRERGPLNFVFGGGAITWMDGFTVRTLWTWAENKVNKEQPGLEKGSQADIDAGNSEYYKAVAAEFEEALSRSQPMYDTMHRANIMRESNPIVRAFTLFKTVPMQEYNMLRQAIGEAQYAKEAKLDKETQAAARQKAGRAFAGILAGNLMIGAITILNALWKNRGKKYRDEDGELSAEKLIAEAGKQYFKDAAGLVIGGGEAADILSSILFGDKWYGLETPGMEQIESILEQTVKAGLTVQGLVRDSIEVLRNGGDWAQYMADHSDKYISAVDSVARTLGTYATGLPIDNVKAYLLGAVQWLSPEVKTAYEDIMDKADRSGLKGLSGASLEIRTKHILQERAGSAEDSTVEALAGLYEAGYKDAIPAAQQTKITVDGEERQLNLAQQQTYKRAWQETVGGSIDELVGSKDFQNADEKTQAKMLKKLYDLASDRAKRTLFDDTEENTWDKAEELLDAGISLEDYVSAYARFNAIKNTENLSSYDKGKQQREMINGMDTGDDAKLALYQSLNPTATSRIEKFKAIMGAGMSFDTLMTVFDKYSAIDEKGDLTASGKAKEFALWVDNQKYSEKQKQTIKDQLLYWQQMSAQTERYDKIKDQGFDPNTAAAIDKALSELTPLPGKDGVSNAQKWNAALKVLGTKASKKDKLSAVSMFFDTAMTTESGKPSQWAKINRVVDSGKSVEDTMKMVEDEKLDVYVKWMDSDAKAAGVKSDTYLAWRETYANTNSTRDENGKEVKGQKKKDKILAYIDGLNLTREQKDALFLEEYKESGLSDTPWHKGGGKGSGSYAMARTPALRIPEAPRAEKPSSGLRIRGTQPGETRQGSGLRIRGTTAEPARQTSGLRIRDAAPAAQAPRSGLRIRAK